MCLFSHQNYNKTFSLNCFKKNVLRIGIVLLKLHLQFIVDSLLYLNNRFNVVETDDLMYLS